VSDWGEVAEVSWSFFKLGLTSFGGPVAHIGYIRAECVERKKWLDDAAYADLVALCNFIPGPASSQVVFAIGMQRAGLLGALGASLGFLAPSGAAMIAFAYGVAALGDLRGAGWLHGLKLAAVAVVAQAVWAMGNKLCTDRARVTMCLAAAALSLVVPGALTQIGLLLAGAALGWRLYRDQPAPQAADAQGVRGHAVAASALALFGLLLLLPRLLAPTLPEASAGLTARFDAFYRSGALVFGGGHVVLPLLREAMVPRGWLSDDAFLAGYGAAQAVPGPLFSFAGYLGAMVWQGDGAWRGGLFGLLAIFLPAWLLIGGALPFWSSLRSRAWMQACLRGANASVVGVLLAALYSPVMSEGVKTPRDAAAAMVAFALLEVWKAPPLAVVALAGAAGQWLLR
jgi:chromate transporter